MKHFFPLLCLAAILVGLGGYFAPELRRSTTLQQATHQWQATAVPLLATLLPSPAKPAQASPSPSDQSPNPAASPVAGPSAGPVSASAPELLNAIVTISGHAGEGTGFICHFRGKIYVATNQHVLGVGTSLMIRASGGAQILARRVFAAGDADIALIECDPLPPGTTVLELAALPDPSIHEGDPVLVLGNSKGDGVITQTPGKLLAVGPQRIEVSNPVYPGNSGSPIIHVGTKKVIGVLTEAELVSLNEFEKASFRSQDSALKSTVRYFGHRLDSVHLWEPLNWDAFQQTEAAIHQSRDELDAIFAYFTDTTRARYKSFKALHEARNEAASVFTDHRVSAADRLAASDRLLRDIDGFARAAKLRLANHKIYDYQQSKVDTINRMSDAVFEVTEIIKRDNTYTASLLARGD